MAVLIFSQSFFLRLREFLFSNVPKENGCFLLGNSYHRRTGEPVIIATEMILPGIDSWNSDGEHMLEPTSSYINNSVVRADNADTSLIFVHTHPGAFHPPSFSSIDEMSNRRLFRNLSQIIPNRPLGSLVLSRKGVHGVLFEKGKIGSISQFKFIGRTYSIEEADGPPMIPLDPTFDRQTRAISQGRNALLRNMKIAIVGVGGTGSAVAVQLARMGVGSLTLLDRDTVEESNVSRVYGSKKKDIGKPKVGVLKKHLSTFSRIKVDAIRADITTEGITQHLSDSDIIFGCTDNLTSRAVLNDVALQYYTPLIDVGCRIHMKGAESIEQAIAKVQVVTPDTACLWCTGTLDGAVIMQEALPANEKRKLVEEGYYQGVEDQPSIISLTTLAASIGVNKLLGLLGIFGLDCGTRTQLELKNGFMIDDSPDVKSDCICDKLRGRGEKRRIPLPTTPMDPIFKNEGGVQT